jgi:RimJ/RimL family protein N-acetyltransferase
MTQQYTLKETTYPALTPLIKEALETRAFLRLQADPKPFLQMMPRLFAGDPNYHLFALRNDREENIGFIVTLPHADDDTLRIGPIYVAERYRGRGAGRRMVELLIAWAKREGVARLFTKTWGGNAASRRIFAGLGFTCIGEEPHTRVNGDSTVKYQRNTGGM